MNRCIEISSKNNPNIKNVLSLKKKRGRKSSDLFIIEGHREIKQALKHDVYFDSVFVCQELMKKKEDKILIDLIRKKNTKVFFVSKNIFLTLCYKESPDPFLVTASFKFLNDTQFFLRKTSDIPLYLLVEAVEKPGNLGALLRNCDAVGISGLIICDPILDIVNPNVIRSSLGTIFSVPILVMNKNDIFQKLKDHGLQIVITTPRGKTLYTNVNFTLPSVIVMGSEKDGVSSFWLEKGDILSKIPMFGSVDSLNIAMSATVFLYEAIRQRHIL